MVKAQLAQRFVEQARAAVDALGDGAEAFWTVINRIHTGHDGEQHLCSTNVRSSFFASDVLFAGLQRHAVGHVALCIYRNANKATRNLALELVAGGEKGGVWTTISHWHPKTLGRTNHHVGTPRTRSGKQYQAHQVSHYRYINAVGFGFAAKIHIVAYTTIPIGVLKQNAKEVVVKVKIFDQTIHQLNAQRFGAGFKHGFGLRKTLLRNKKLIALAGSLHAMQHEHGFRSGCSFVEQTRVGNFHARKVAYQGLEIDECLEATLRNFGLVRRILGVPTWIFENVTENYPRYNHVIITETDIIFINLIFIGHLAQRLQHLKLVEGRSHLHGRLAADVGRNGLLD